MQLAVELIEKQLRSKHERSPGTLFFIREPACSLRAGHRRRAYGNSSGLTSVSHLCNDPTLDSPLLDKFGIYARLIASEKEMQSCRGRLTRCTHRSSFRPSTSG